MRRDEDYKRLVKGYQLALSILKEIKPKLYKRMMHIMQLLDKHGGHFSDLIRNLRIDFASGNDLKRAETPKIVLFFIFSFLFPFFYSLTPPTLTPAAKYFCIFGYITMIGIIEHTNNAY